MIASRKNSPAGPRVRAFTLAELMIATSVFSLVVIGILIVQMFGMRMYQISEAKMSSTANGRKALNRVRGDILEGRTMNIQSVTNGNYATHAGIADFTPQVGNAIQIYPSASSPNFVLYYTDPANTCLKRYTSSNSQVEIVARYVTNTYPFQAENFQGNVLATNENNRVIRVVLEFSQWEALQANGKASLYDSYRVQTRITRRTTD